MVEPDFGPKIWVGSGRVGPDSKKTGPIRLGWPQIGFKFGFNPIMYLINPNEPDLNPLLGQTRLSLTEVTDEQLFKRLQEYALSMSAKPATIYLGTRSHRSNSKNGQQGRYRNLMKRAYKAGKQPILNNKTTTLAVRRYHHNQLSVKKVVKLANQVGQR